MPVARLTYFSGTGNTRWVTNRLAAALRNQGYQPVIVEVGPSRHGRPPETSARSSAGVELDVFLFPVFAFGVPAIYRRYLARLGRVATLSAAVVTVVGDVCVGRGRGRRLLPGWGGRAAFEAKSLLERRGFRVFSTRAVGMPASYTQLWPSPTPEDQQTILTAAAAAVDRMARDLARRDESHLRVHPAHTLWSVPVRLAFRLVGRRFSGKLYAADERCDGCGLCATACPSGVIRMRAGLPRWGWSCQACQRCMNVCPTQAIQVTLPRSLTLTAAGVFPYHTVLGLESLWGRLGRLGEIGAVSTRIVGWAAVAMAALIVLDRLLGLAERGRPALLRRVVTWGLTRRWARYAGPPAPRRGR